MRSTALSILVLDREKGKFTFKIFRVDELLKFRLKCYNTARYKK